MFSTQVLNDFTWFGISLKHAYLRRRQAMQVNEKMCYYMRMFSKYFDDLSFGDYIRKLRIEKAIQLLNDPKYSLSEIAYLTGFSDQSHFTRIFKKVTGKSPSVYKKNIATSKADTKGK